MKLRARNVAWLLPFLLTACFHKTHHQQVQSLAEPLGAEPKPELTQPGLLPSTIIPNLPIKTDSDEKHSSQPPVQHKKPSAKTAPQASSSTPAASPETPAVSVIGQLSSGDPSGLRRETVSSIEATERGLNGIGRTLNGQEQVTAAQIRSFLKQAREAMAASDVDGAHTLAAKAKVLLGELRR
jgi:hypothetical protein